MKKIKFNGNVYEVSDYVADAIQTAKDFYEGTRFLSPVIESILAAKGDNAASRALMAAHNKYLSLC